MSRKLEILKTALMLFNETNTQTATTNHIAKAMNISPGNLHYHYKNREEIIRTLYLQMKEKTTLAVVDLPNTLTGLNEHQTTLMHVQWEYRFFFKELLFLFSRDKELENIYIRDNLAHRSRIKIVVQNLIKCGEMQNIEDDIIEFIVDSVLLSWQFYISYMYTLGEGLDSNNVDKVIKYVNYSMKPYLNN